MPDPGFQIRIKIRQELIGDAIEVSNLNFRASEPCNNVLVLGTCSNLELLNIEKSMHLFALALSMFKLQTIIILKPVMLALSEPISHNLLSKGTAVRLNCGQSRQKFLPRFSRPTPALKTSNLRL